MIFYYISFAIILLLFIGFEIDRHKKVKAEKRRKGFFTGKKVKL